MSRILRSFLALAVVTVTVGLTTISSSAGSTPRWVLHAKTYKGGISNGVRAYLDPAITRAQARYGHKNAFSASVVASKGARLRNVQTNTDSNPPLPQNETSIALNVHDPMNAVGAANDFVEGGLWIGHTTNGGRSWESWFQAPESLATGDKCFGSDPSVVYSRRDKAFFVSTLCFNTNAPTSELHVWKSVDGGETWTPPFLAAVPISNVTFDPNSGEITIDSSVFYDKELLAVDNNPGSPYYGRLYVTYIKFHMRPDGFSDYCPVNLSYSDEVPTEDPSLAEWHGPVQVVPDDPGDDGAGPSANQWATPVIDRQGGVNIAYALEDCNNVRDRSLKFKRSTNGGKSFPAAPVTITDPNEFADNPDFNGDQLPPKEARIPISPSLAYNPADDALEYVYQNAINLRESDTDISYQRSTDHGKTWSDAKFISITNKGEPAPNDQFFPAIAADERGDLHAIWFDNRKDPDNLLIRTFQALSTDRGETWTNFDISTKAWNPNEAFFDSGSFIGDYNWIAASNKVIYPLWTDGRDNPGPPLGETDIFTNVEIGGPPHK